MQSSDLPTRIQLPFADSGSKNTIPTAASATPGRASYEEGFPPETMVPPGSGGVAPFGQDFNGVFYDLSRWNRWGAAGGPVFYNSAFSTAVGGYPQGANLASTSSFSRVWTSLVNNNTSDPDAGGANWVSSNYSEMQSVTTTTTLTYASIGRIIAIGAPSNYTVTLPSAAAAPRGSQITVIHDHTSGNAVLSATGGQVISIGRSVAAQTLGLLTGDMISLASDGVSVWVAYAYRRAVRASYSANGFRQSDDGTIEQWGSGASVTGNGDPVSFPISFPTAVFSVLVTEANASGWGSSPPQPTVYGLYGVPTLTGFQVSACRVLTTGGSAYAGGLGYTWRALGR